MKLKLAAALGLIVISLTFAVPAHAASKYDLDQTFQIRIQQSATGGDNVYFKDLYGGMNSALDESAAYSAVENALGINTAKADAHYDPDNNGDSVTKVSTHQNVFAYNNGAYKLDVDTSAIADALGNTVTDKFSVGVCPVQTNATDSSSRSADYVDSDNNCSWWIQDADSEPTHISFVETPKADAWYRSVGWLIGVAAALGAVGLVIGYLLRRRLNQLRTPNIVLVILGSFAAWLLMIISWLGTLGGSDSLNEFALANNLSQGQLTVWTFVIGLFWSLPFLLPTLMLATVPPPDMQATQTPAGTWSPSASAGPAIPSWLGVPTSPPQPAPQNNAAWMPPPPPTPQPPTPPAAPAPGQWQPEQPPVLPIDPAAPIPPTDQLPLPETKPDDEPPKPPPPPDPPVWFPPA